MDENEKNFVNNIIKHIRTVPDGNETLSDTEEESTQTSVEPTAEQASDNQTAQNDTAAADEASPEHAPSETTAPSEAAPVSDAGSAPAEDESQKELRLNSFGAASQPQYAAKYRAQKNTVSEKEHSKPQHSDSFISKLGATLAERSVFCGILIYIVFTVNIIGMILYSRRAGLGLTQSVLYQFHFDSIAFKSFTFLEISVLVSYMVAFILGGLIIFILLKIGSSLAGLCGFAYSHKFTRFLLFIFMAVYSAASLITILSGSNILTVAVYKWATPLFTVAGGLIMYCMSLRKLDIN